MLKILMALALILTAQAGIAATWRLHPDETRVSVDVPYLGSIVALRFPTIAGLIDFDVQQPQNAGALITVNTSDVATGSGLVDAFVKTRGYLNVTEHPQITFTLDQLVQTSKSTADIFGTMTLLGQTRPVSFKATVFRYGPAADDPTRFEAGFDLVGEIDRTDFGNTSGLPQVAANLPVRIHLLMTSK